MSQTRLTDMSAPSKGADSTENGQSRVFKIAGACCLALFVFAFVAAPHSCEWGLTAYFWAGVT